MKVYIRMFKNMIAMQPSNALVDEENCNISASKDWHYWCRLCAKDDIHSSNIFNTSEKSDNDNTADKAIWKYFCVQIKHDDDLPKLLCTDCNSMLSSLHHFHERVVKVQTMYAALQNDGYSHDKDLNSIRKNFGILKEDFAHFYMQQCIQNCFNEKDSMSHLEYFEIKLEKENVSDSIQPDEVSCAIEEDVALAEDPFASDVDGAPDECNKISNASSGIADKVPNFTPSKYYGNEASVKNKRQQKKQRLDVKSKVQKYMRKQSEKNNGGSNIEECAEGSKEPSGENKYFCSDCSLQFQRPGSYDLHMKKRHGLALEPLECPQCSKSFKSRTHLNLHMKKHRPLSEKRIFPCPQCDRKFQKKDYVAKHIKFVHEDIRPFICEECGEGLRTKATLEEHMLTHTDHAPFECEICKKGFKNQARLKRHMDIHSSTKYTCIECGLQLNSRVTLNRHMLVHSDTIRHKCDYCGRGFKRTKTLKTHLILHSGLKPYSCKFCEKTFTDGSNRRTHMKRAHPSELAMAEALGEKTYTKNIPNLAVLKAVTQSAENLVPVVSKQSGNFSLGRRPKPPIESTVGIKNSNSTTGTDESTEITMSNRQTIFKEKSSEAGSFSNGNIPSPLW